MDFQLTGDEQSKNFLPRELPGASIWSDCQATPRI